jgi:hypothetical protein
MDNLEVLKQNLDTAIDPNAGIGEILAQEHNDMVTEFISKQGKYVGSPFNAKANYNGIANAGDFFINGALNDTNGISITTAQRTNDLNDFSIVLNTLGDGDIMHLKDFVGRSFYFIFKSYAEAQDNNGNTVYELKVVPFADNINYTYQAKEVRLCVVEFLKSGSAGVKNYFENLELDLFWNGRGYNKNQNPSEYSKFVDLYKFVATDGNSTFCKTIPTKVYFLGIEFKGYEKLKGFRPELVIERYKRAHQNKSQTQNGDEYHKSPSMYRSTFFYNQQILANIYVPNQNLVYRDNIDRNQIISLTGSREYYDIDAENYFSQVDTPKALGNQNFKTYPKNTTVIIEDDMKRYSRKSIPKRQKGYAHCRLRIRIDVTGKGDFLYSPVLAYFKIKNQLIWDDRSPNEVQSSVINYSYE